MPCFWQSRFRNWNSTKKRTLSNIPKNPLLIKLLKARQCQSSIYMFSMSFALFTSIHNHALSSGYTFGTLIHTSPLTNTPSSPSCIRGLDLINLSFQINNHQTLANILPAKELEYPTMSVPCWYRNSILRVRTRFFQGSILVDFFFGLLDIIHFFQEDKVGDWKLVKKKSTSKLNKVLLLWVTRTRRFLKHL